MNDTETRQLMEAAAASCSPRDLDELIRHLENSQLPRELAILLSALNQRLRALLDEEALRKQFN